MKAIKRRERESKKEEKERKRESKKRGERAKEERERESKKEEREREFCKWKECHKKNTFVQTVTTAGTKKLETIETFF